MSLKDPKNQKILNDFMSEHAPLIHKQINILKAKNKIPQNIDHEDLVFHGVHGLIDALHRFDSGIAEKLSTKEGENTFAKYAQKRIQGKMLDHISSQDQIPKQVRAQAKRLEARNKPKVSEEQQAPTPAPTQVPEVPES